MNTIPEDLPELPKPSFGKWTRGGLLTEEAFTADQMRDYARAAIAADRSRASLASPAPDASALVESARVFCGNWQRTGNKVNADRAKLESALQAYDQQTGWAS